MIKLFIYKAILLSLPIQIILLFFVVVDPFLIIHEYNDYTKTYRPSLNKDFISGETYINKREKYHYNSFIFGSSRTLAYPVKSWQKHLDKKAIPFKFDASGETISGIHSKIKYIDSQKDTIQNALLVFCQNKTFVINEDKEGILFMKHPKISQTSSFEFYTEFVKAFFERNFMVSFIIYFFTDKQLIEKYKDTQNAKLDTINNDLFMQAWEKELKDSTQNYYEKRKEIFYQRDTLPVNNQLEIKPQQIVMLKEMKHIFDNHKTNYKIVISPLYNQIYFNKTDIKVLQDIFGVKNIYDYSGINDYTKKVENYYETSHYRLHVGEAIMSEIYMNHQQ